MKTKTFFTFMILTILFTQLLSQRRNDFELILEKYPSTPFAKVFNEPIIVSPLIGEKIDQAENEYFNLFPNINGFQEAVFYFNPDSSLKAELFYRINEETKDVLIPYHMSLNHLQSYILQLIINNVESGITYTVILTFNDGTELQRIMLSIDKKSITTIDPLSLKTVAPGNLDVIISKNSLENIKSILIEETGSEYWIIAGAGLVGTVSGAIIGFNKATSGDDPWSDSETYFDEGILGCILGGAIGGLSGLLFGKIISTSDTEYKADEILDYSELREYTLIPNRIDEAMYR